MTRGETRAKSKTGSKGDAGRTPRRSLPRRALRGVGSSRLMARTLALVPVDGAVVLRYHSVNDDPGWARDYIQASLAIPPAVFDRQMSFLRERFQVVGIGELADMMRQGARLGSRLAAVTFDDGYEDNYRNAFPILRRHGLTAAFYVTSGAVSDATILWTVKLRHAIRKCRRPSLTVPSACDIPIDVSRDGSKERAIRLLSGAIKRRPGLEADRLLKEILEACDGEVPAPDRRIIVNEAELREMNAAGMTIGAHTVNHYNLTWLVKNDLASELRDSRRFLQGVIGAPVRHLAYPDGRTTKHFDGRVARVAEEEGFLSAVTSISGPASSEYPVLGIPRLGVVPSHRRVGRLAVDMELIRMRRPRDAVFDEVRSATGRTDAT